MKRVALLGMPNTGKSTFFNRLTGAHARVGNWPGITVDLMSAKILLGAQMVELVDLPGVYDLPGSSDDERVAQQFLETTPVDLILLILNATQIERQLSLFIHARRFGVPVVLLLNMADEARNFGIRIDAERMSALLGAPVVLLSAKYGEGYSQSHEVIRQQLAAAPSAAAPPRIDNDADVDQVLRDSVSMPVQLPQHLTHRIDHWLLHPWLGLPLFFGIMFLVFQSVFWLGGPLQEAVAWVLDALRTHVLEGLLSPLPAQLQGLLLDGVYDGVGTVASFVPVIVLFFLFMTVVEDSGYLSRAAFLMDALMARMGLDGRSFVMLLMGFGCNVPALMGTRVMRTTQLRWLSMLIIPFSLCSARLQVFVFILAILFPPQYAALALFSLYLLSFASAFLTALLFKGRYHSNEPFLLEVPPYRLPTLRQVFLRAWLEVSHFLARATRFIIAGVVLVWVLTHYPEGATAAGRETWAGILGGWLSPIFSPLGISQELIIALLFGFVAKEVVVGSLAVIYGAEGDNLGHLIGQQMDWVQAYSFMLFTLLYTPCLSTIATIRSESRSWSFTLLNLAWPLGLAWVMSFMFYQTARALLG